MNTVKLLNTLLTKNVINNTVKRILENIKNNLINTDEIIHLAKYGTFHKNYSLVQLAYIYDVNIHVDDDYIFRKALQKRDSNILTLLLKDNYEYYEKLFFSKKSVSVNILEAIVYDNSTESHDGEYEVNLTDDQKIIIKNILTYMFLNDIEIKIDSGIMNNILKSNMESQLIEIIEKHNDFIEIFFRCDKYDFESVLSIIIYNNIKLFENILKVCTHEQTDKIVEYYFTRYDTIKINEYYFTRYDTIKIKINDMFNPDYIFTPELFHKLFNKDDIKRTIEKLSQMPINKKAFIEHFSKIITKDTSDQKINQLIIPVLINSNLFTKNELKNYFDEKYIKQCIDKFH